MSGDTFVERPRRHVASMARVHDYLYDSAFIVSGARDYARTAFKAAMSSAQVIIQPVYKSMFSDIRHFPRMNMVYHTNCRLPDHIDRSYGAYLQRFQASKDTRSFQLSGKDRFKFAAAPKKVLALQNATPEFHPPTPQAAPTDTKPRSKGTQSLFRESSAQTIPWQPDAKQADTCVNTPEVIYLDQLEWGPGKPYRLGDLPADFHTTEIINKMRHARAWAELAERGDFPRWMKKREAIITDVETKDWIFREAEIDELQDIRLELLHRLQQQQRTSRTNKTSKKLAKLWTCKKLEMEKKVDHIRRSRDRELRKLTALHSGGGRIGLVQRLRAARGAESMTLASHDPTSDLHAPVTRHGYQARRRHAEIYYDPMLLSLEDHEAVAQPPAWLEECGQNLKRTCSGHHLPPNRTQLCERETKWSEQFLESLHNDLKKARLGAAINTTGPLHVLKPRHVAVTPRPSTPEVDGVNDSEEVCYQSALLLQKIIKGRAVQNLMYEGRTRAAELTEELKTTHGLQKEDKARIAHEEARAREYRTLRREADAKDDAISALVDELCGGAVSAALDFLEKELKRLKEERRQHAFILIAIRDKTMREAAEAGRRQKEEHRRREHDEMFKQVLGVTQETVDAYLREVIEEGVKLAAEEDAVRRAVAEADRVDESLRDHDSMSTAEQNELVADLVQHVLLPSAHKEAARLRISALQQAKMDAARNSIFQLLDDAEVKEQMCTQCGQPLSKPCPCRVCPKDLQPIETASRQDPRWKFTWGFPKPPEKTVGERFPLNYDIRRMLDVLVDEAVQQARSRREELSLITRMIARSVRERTEANLDAKEFVDELLDRAMGEWDEMLRRSPHYHHYMQRIVVDALQRFKPAQKRSCPKELPSEIRRRAEEAAALLDPSCRCVPENLEDSRAEDDQPLLSALRILEEMRRCKCDSSNVRSSIGESAVDSTSESGYTEVTTEPETAPED